MASLQFASVIKDRRGVRLHSGACLSARGSRFRDSVGIGTRSSPWCYELDRYAFQYIWYPPTLWAYFLVITTPSPTLLSQRVKGLLYDAEYTGLYKLFVHDNPIIAKKVTITAEWLRRTLPQPSANSPKKIANMNMSQLGQHLWKDKRLLLLHLFDRVVCIADNRHPNKRLFYGWSLLSICCF